MDVSSEVVDSDLMVGTDLRPMSRLSKLEERSEVRAKCRGDCGGDGFAAEVAAREAM